MLVTALLEWVSSSSLCHSRQCRIVLKPLSDHGIDHTVVCFVTQRLQPKIIAVRCEQYQSKQSVVK